MDKNIDPPNEERTVPFPESLNIPQSLFGYQTEKELEDDVVKYAHELARMLGIKKLLGVERQKAISPVMFKDFSVPLMISNYFPIIDVLLIHDGGFTIVEVKKNKTKLALFNAVPQVLAYRQVFHQSTGVKKENISCVVVADKLNKESMLMVEEFNLPVSFVQWGFDKVALWKKL